MPVLSPCDLFLGQALHLFKHVCSDFCRTAHLLEFRRHVTLRYNDGAFWTKLREVADRDRQATLALGLATLLISQVMGDFAPAALTCWTVIPLPALVRRWAEVYGHHTVLASFPGSKLYLLLQAELERVGLPAKRSLPRALLPRRLPPAIAPPAAEETFVARARRHRRQTSFIAFRLRFHIVEGLRYLVESIRWRREKRSGL